MTTRTRRQAIASTFLVLSLACLFAPGSLAAWLLFALAAPVLALELSRLLEGGPALSPCAAPVTYAEARAAWPALAQPSTPRPPPTTTLCS